MPRLIDLNGDLLANDWVLLEKTAELEAALTLPASSIIVPLQLWQSSKPALLASTKAVAVWLDSNEQAHTLADDLSVLQMIALNFPGFMDGRSYSSATNLRTHYHYSGEIRAIGDVLRDQLFYMRRCGFTTFELKDSVNLEDARKALKDFTDNYQATIEQPLPLFRRRQNS